MRTTNKIYRYDGQWKHLVINEDYKVQHIAKAHKPQGLRYMTKTQIEKLIQENK